MKTLRGTVEGGVIKLPPDSQLQEGTQVVVAVIGPLAADKLLPTPEIETEDVAFIRSRRPSLNRILRAEEE